MAKHEYGVGTVNLRLTLCELLVWLLLGTVH